jgi:predicted CopG family antitoxin
MAVKTITIDMEAYEILSRHKGAGQSFSQVIKERFGRRMTGKELLGIARHAGLSEKTLDAIEARVRAHRGEKARRVKLY